VFISYNNIVDLLYIDKIDLFDKIDLKVFDKIDLFDKICLKAHTGLVTQIRERTKGYRRRTLYRIVLSSISHLLISFGAKHDFCHRMDSSRCSGRSP
jgi:hypothetical protein